MSQNRFTLSFSLNSPADAKAFAEQLPPLMPGLLQAAEMNRARWPAEVAGGKARLRADSKAESAGCSGNPH